MKPKILTAALLASAFTLSSCDKENTPAEDVGDSHLPVLLLEKVEYKELQLTSYFVYNADSTVKQIVHANASSGAEVNYTYNNRLLTKTEVPGSYYITHYGYTNGKLTSVTGTQKGEGIIGYGLEYQYTNTGRPDKLLHYKLDEAGKHLQATISYQYNQQGLPEKVTSVQAAATLTWTIENYSDSCYIEPKAFVTGHSLDELYAIYNFPVLTRLARFPQKITLSIARHQETPKVEKIYENICTVANKRLDKIRMSVTYPENPQITTTEEVSFFYK